MDSIYDQIGGTAAVSATVEELYARVLADPRLAPFFAGVDSVRRRHDMRAFVATALGATRVSSPADGRAGLGLTERDFDRVAGHLAGALRTIGLPSDQIQRILSRIAPRRDGIAGGEPAPV